MEKKSNKGLSVIFVIFIILLLLLLGLILLLVYGQSAVKQKDGNAGPFVIKDSETGKETEQGNTKASESESSGRDKTEEKEITVVFGGYRFTLSSAYSCFYAEEIGPVIYMDNFFQMRLGIRQDSYEEAMENPESLTEKTVAAGGEILQDLKEASVDGKSYAYFRMELYGAQCFVVYTALPEGEKQLAGQIMIESDELTDADFLNIFADIAVTAEATDGPDSTMEDIVEQMAERADAAPGERKENGILRFDEETVIFGVPENFYSMGIAETDIYSEETFLTGDFAVMADCYLWSAKAETSYYKSAEEYISMEWNNLYDNVKNEVEIQTMEIEGKQCYYIAAHYQFDGRDYQHVYAACDVGKYGIYTVLARAVDQDTELSMEILRDFFVFYSEDVMKEDMP